MNAPEPGRVVVAHGYTEAGGQVARRLAVFRGHGAEATPVVPQRQYVWPGVREIPRHGAAACRKVLLRAARCQPGEAAGELEGGGPVGRVHQGRPLEHVAGALDPPHPPPRRQRADRDAEGVGERLAPARRLDAPVDQVDPDAGLAAAVDAARRHGRARYPLARPGKRGACICMVPRMYCLTYVSGGRMV